MLVPAKRLIPSHVMYIIRLITANLFREMRTAALYYTGGDFASRNASDYVSAALHDSKKCVGTMPNGGANNALALIASVSGGW